MPLDASANPRACRSICGCALNPSFASAPALPLRSSGVFSNSAVVMGLPELCKTESLGFQNDCTGFDKPALQIDLTLVTSIWTGASGHGRRQIHFLPACLDR